MAVIHLPQPKTAVGKRRYIPEGVLACGAGRDISSLPDGVPFPPVSEPVKNQSPSRFCFLIFYMMKRNKNCSKIQKSVDNFENDTYNKIVKTNNKEIID